MNDGWVLWRTPGFNAVCELLTGFTLYQEGLYFGVAVSRSHGEVPSPAHFARLQATQEQGFIDLETFLGVVLSSRITQSTKALTYLAFLVFVIHTEFFAGSRSGPILVSRHGERPACA